MIDHNTEFEATAGGLVLSNAILLYRAPGDPNRPAREDEPAFASIHAVEMIAGRPAIAAGAPLSRGHLGQWTKALSKNAPPEMLPENVIVAHPDLLVWWVTERVRPAYFDLTLRRRTKLKMLAARTSVMMPYPAHLLVATRGGLGVFALPESKRPTAATELLHSPVLNVFLNGQLCWGNIPKPKTIAVASMPEYERAVFDSWSTHPNHGQDLTVTGKGGLVKLWDDLAAREAKRFPVARLKTFHPGERGRDNAAPITLGKLIEGITRS